MVRFEDNLTVVQMLVGPAYFAEEHLAIVAAAAAFHQDNRSNNLELQAARLVLSALPVPLVQLGPSNLEAVPTVRSEVVAAKSIELPERFEEFVPATA